MSIVDVTYRHQERDGGIVFQRPGGFFEFRTAAAVMSGSEKNCDLSPKWSREVDTAQSVFHSAFEVFYQVKSRL